MKAQSDDGREIQRAIRTNVLQMRFVCSAAVTFFMSLTKLYRPLYIGV